MYYATDLPSLRASIRLGGKDTEHDVKDALYDVKFYPYIAPGGDPVFAVTGGAQTFICRALHRKDEAIEVLRWFNDDNASVQLNSLAWTKSSKDEPMVCVSGDNAKIKIYNVLTGELTRVLVGHGSLINDLAISPASPTILTSASGDHSIRVWDLTRRPSKNPCSVICSGGGHKEGVLAIGFHDNGRYLLSGGLDTIVNLWVLPDLTKTSKDADDVAQVHYPHFSTTELHHDFVDCLKFYHDLILSRASKENRILLWKIDGFSSSDAIPPPSTAPTSSQLKETRSAFGGKFQRLLQFDAPHTTLFYMRFGLFHQPYKRPVLVIGNEKSRFFFWDLQRLEEGFDAALEDGGSGSLRVPQRGRRGKSALGLVREQSVASEASSGVGSSNSGSTGPERKFVINDPFTSVTTHKRITVPKIAFATRQIAWSPGGEWAVAVGDHGMVVLFRRWD